jgi:hypothetical protein
MMMRKLLFGLMIVVGLTCLASSSADAGWRARAYRNGYAPYYGGYYVPPRVGRRGMYTWNYGNPASYYGSPYYGYNNAYPAYYGGYAGYYGVGGFGLATPYVSGYVW